MLIYDPAARLSAKDILRSSYFNDLDKHSLPAGDYDGTLVVPDI